ncbi:hypothetical protein D8674_001270 [Pyrus ussuriensis x Pyrus communis]|uniref:Uncharacterized protein n=1 Tax=Pyrus ussuriensis x Pyrus communis TaxID=2448454 RepID=A0A5N5FB55_9ROSA|nr:hypothetical protein D8674_001270 [Pyrus ussuriensis x Pyrus communis]
MPFTFLSSILLVGLVVKFEYKNRREGDENVEEPAFVASKTSKTSNISPILTYPEGENSKGSGFTTRFSSFKFSALEPSLLGIHPEPPDWPERSEIVRTAMERKANSLEFPVSLRLIKKKQRQQREEGPKGGAGEITFCSLNKAFSSMVFIICELHSHALSIRESLYSEDLHEVIAKVQKREMSMSFVWLFQQVFSGSPTLMVYVMILLANFSVYSMNCNVVAATPLPVMAETLTETEEQPYSKSDYISDDDSTRVVKKTSNEGSKADFRDNVTSESSIRHAIVDLEKMYGEDVKLWNSVMEQASRMQSEMRDEALDHATVQQFHYFRTDLLYQMGLAQDPHNALLLSNYAQFLHVVARDHDREKPDAEALIRYADFLWIVRKDLWGAEERYQQAMAEEPDNPYYASRYANFLWSTGAEDTCFPLSTSYDNYNKVL